ncbi:related to putative glutathione S-transferase [Cephalotrichum gorgonifer]|uniref:Related to putative glutathione S-transferase n=1 Tax=Cephalotrichum gorgonifer TaxID=2041049 RepID=A0AAE8MW72_9PEZI|nr:related to putative glutathione S-transferase [Cephalotrichum gorgonifer]
MAAQTEPEIVLYDLASTKNVCFSPVVWRIRLLLNYKRIPYKTIFLEFPDIEPTLKALGLPPHESGASGSKLKYTVPAIHHLPTNTYIMDSTPISEFLDKTYPDPPVPLSSELGREIETKGRAAFGQVFLVSLLPREAAILSPRSQEYFRRTREAWLGHPLEDLLDPEKEEKVWSAAGDDMRALGELMLTNKADGPFVLGARPSYTDFFIAGSLQSSRMVDEGVFQRTIVHPGFKEIYEACLPYMEKKD